MRRVAGAGRVVAPGPAVALALALTLALFAAADFADAAPPPPEPRKSGAEFMSESTRLMQRDDTQNPAMLWVSGGESLWNAKAGAGAKACADCHGDARTSMRGVAARYPVFDQESAKVITLGERIGQCRSQRQQAPPFKAESEEALGLESYVALQSRGLPIAPPQDEKTRAAVERGRQHFFRRVGQLNLSCAQCHDQNWGRKLAGAPIPQGHANAYPIYRLEWQGMGSLQRRLRNCMSGVRAEVPPFGAQVFVELEAYLADRARGMPLETPGVRP